MTRPKMTHPLDTSPPLPPTMSAFEFPDVPTLHAEARRAAAELLWALHRQRTAWAKLARIKTELGERNIEFIEGERPYKLAVGDVQWWRGEVSSRANALQALLAAIGYRQRL